MPKNSYHHTNSISYIFILLLHTSLHTYFYLYYILHFIHLLLLYSSFHTYFYFYYILSFIHTSTSTTFFISYIFINTTIGKGTDRRKKSTPCTTRQIHETLSNYQQTTLKKTQGNCSASRGTSSPIFRSSLGFFRHKFLNQAKFMS